MDNYSSFTSDTAEYKENGWQLIWRALVDFSRSFALEHFYSVKKNKKNFLAFCLDSL